MMDRSQDGRDQGGAVLGGALRRLLSLVGFIAVAALVLWVTDIGCVFRLMTGVPCPGCGITRAWLALLRLDPAAALAYHPLFWMLPVALVLAVAEPRVRHRRVRRAIEGLLAAMTVALVAVWAVRLVSPADAGLLFGGHIPAGVPRDIIHVETPRILRLLGL